MANFEKAVERMLADEHPKVTNSFSILRTVGPEPEPEQDESA